MFLISIKITQTFLIKNIPKYLFNKGWNRLYTDLPGGPRSGIGIERRVHLAFEHIYDMAPDILSQKDNTALIRLKNYINKFRGYKEKSERLKKELNKYLEKEISNIIFGFGYIGGDIRENEKEKFGNIILFGAENESIICPNYWLIEKNIEGLEKIQNKTIEEHGA